MNDISVIIVSWNAQRYLRECLHSIRRTGNSLVGEIVVVDNRSTDGSPEMVEKEFPEVKLIRCDENLGFARANNLGMSYVSKQFLALVNSDVVVHEGCFESLSGFLSDHATAGLVGPRIFGSDGKLQCTCRRLPTIWNTICRILALDTVFSSLPGFAGRELRNLDHEQPAEVEVLSGCFWLVRRAAVDRIGGLDERFFFYAEDVDWCKRFLDAGWKAFFLPQATATHFGGASSSNAPIKYSIEMLRANIAYWRKHYGLPGQSAFYVLCVVHHGIRLLVRPFIKIITPVDSRDINPKLREDFSCLRWLLTGKGV